MAYGEIIYPLTGAEDEFLHLSNLALLAKKIDAEATLFFVSQDPNDALLLSTDGMVVTLGETLVESLEKANAQVWEHIVNKISQYPAFNLERNIGLVDELLLQRAVLSDLLVVSKKCASGKSNLSSAFENSLINGHIPTFVLGDNVDNIQNIAIAWDGSAQAARAVRAAMPLLKSAKNVVILQIDGANNCSASIIQDPQELHKILFRHGINSHIKSLSFGDNSVAKGILQLCEESEVGVLVAGAYGHSKARELVFGGTTKSLLKFEKGPNLLICH